GVIVLADFHGVPQMVGVGMADQHIVDLNVLRVQIAGPGIAVYVRVKDEAFPAVVQNKTRVPQVGEFYHLLAPLSHYLFAPRPNTAPGVLADTDSPLRRRKSHGPAPPAAPRPLPGAPPGT